jgi:hypothetical protein
MPAQRTQAAVRRRASGDDMLRGVVGAGGPACVLHY